MSLVPTICAACAELLVSPAITEPHEHMTHERTPANAGSPDDGRYRCMECDSLWTLTFKLGKLDKARLIDQGATPTSRMLTGCPRPWHSNRSEPCRALYWPGKPRLLSE